MGGVGSGLGFGSGRGSVTVDGKRALEHMLGCTYARGRRADGPNRKRAQTRRAKSTVMPIPTSRFLSSTRSSGGAGLLNSKSRARFSSSRPPRTQMVPQSLRLHGYDERCWGHWRGSREGGSATTHKNRMYVVQVTSLMNKATGGMTTASVRVLQDPGIGWGRALEAKYILKRPSGGINASIEWTFAVWIVLGCHLDRQE